MAAKDLLGRRGEDLAATFLTAAGYLVALMEDARGPEGHVLKVVVGPAGQNLCEAVAVMPATEEGRVDADASAMAVLRALEIVEQGDAPASA